VPEVYPEQLVEHAEHPHNEGRLKGATHEATLDNPLCGDAVAIQLRVAGSTVVEAKHVTNGCMVSIAGASLLTDSIRGKRLNQLKNLSRERFLKGFGYAFTPSRTKCALLAYEAMQRILQPEPPKR
jgi:nitrogen fixation NifU-like protein